MEKIETQRNRDLAQTPTSNEQDVNALPVAGSWSLPYQGRQNLLLGVSSKSLVGGGIVGTLSVEGPARGQMKIENIEVEEDFRGHGLGKRLLQSFAAEAKNAGAMTLVGDIISEQEMHNRLQTFGEGNVTFFQEIPSTDGHGSEIVDLPLTREQAIQSLQRVHQHNIGVDDADVTISARTDLTAVDTSSWEVATIGDISRRPDLYNQLNVVTQAVGSLALGGPDN